MKISDLLEATRKVPVNTFTPRADGTGGLPGVKAPKPAVDNAIKKVEQPKLDMKQEFPIIDHEFDRRLYDEDLVDAVKDAADYTDAQWKALPVIDQIKHQLDMLTPPPRKGETWQGMEEKLDKQAKAIMSKLKFIQKEAQEQKDAWAQGYNKGLKNYKDVSSKHNPFEKGTKDFNDFHAGFEEGIKDSKTHWE